MTTAHRPTWNAAAGTSNQGGWSSGGQISNQFSARDLPAHRKLKLRQDGQGTVDEVSVRDLKKELLRKELLAKNRVKKEGNKGIEKLRKLRENRQLLLKDNPEAKENDLEIKAAADDYNDEDDSGDEESSDSDSDSDDEDEEAELLRELEKIKKERESERLLEENRKKQEAEAAEKEQMLKGNPLTQLGQGGSAAIKRKWNDDVVFKNQTRNEPTVKKRFINDTIRNDFHRRFLNRYIQ